MAASKTDLMYEIEYNPTFAPIRSQRVNVKTVIVDNEPKRIMKNHATGAYYDLDELSYDVWNLIDGKKTIKEITNDILPRWKDKDAAVDADTVREVCSFFAESNCLRSTYEAVQKKRVRVVSAFEVDVTLIKNSGAALEKIHKAIKPLLKSPLLWITLVFIGLNSLAFSGSFASIFADSRNFEVLGSTVVGLCFYFFVVLGPVIVIHELAHAIALVHYGGTPGEIGTGLFYFGPMFYVDATDSWMLSSKRQRIVVMMGGIISTLLIGSFIITWSFLWPFPASISHIMYMAAFFCFYSTLINLAPPFETDGYYVLSELLNVPTLKEDAYDYLKTTFKKALRRPVEEVKGLSKRKKRILLGYAVLSAVWIVYTVYQTLIFTLYMAVDAVASFFTISSAVLSVQTFSAAALTVSLVSIAYFAMTVSGYGVILVSAVGKAVNRTLRFESIHDRDLSVFLYLPTQVPKSIADDLDRKIRKLAKKLTPNYSIRKNGPLHLVVLRMGGIKLATVQIKEHLRKIEARFYSMYQKFLLRNHREISESIGVYSPSKNDLTTLLRDMTSEIQTSGMPEAKNVFNQIIERQNRVMLYLLNSAFSTAWTIELPPIQEQELLITLLPTLFAEDLAMTDLYGEVEEFKKNSIYGYDSLAKFGLESQEGLDRALIHPEKHQIISFFEPVKSRLILVGRTEKIEKDIEAFGSLFVCQAWCGYLDNLLSETNLTLAALGRVPSIEKEDIETLSDGELSVLRKNLSAFVAYENQLITSLKRSQHSMSHAIQTAENLRSHFLSSESLHVGLLSSIFAINAENLRHLPKRFETYKDEFHELITEVKNTERTIRAEYNKREPSFAKKKHKMLLTYPIAIAVSAILALLGFIIGSRLANVLFVTAAILSNAIYWVIYYLRTRSFRMVRKHPSPAFSSIQMLLLAFAQTIHKFIATSDVLNPAENSVFSTSHKISESETHEKKIERAN